MATIVLTSHVPLSLAAIGAIIRNVENFVIGHFRVTGFYVWNNFVKY